MLMGEEKMEAFMREQNKNLQKQGVRLKIPVCSTCGEPMQNVIDLKTKKIDKYGWETTCEHFKGRRLYIG